VKDRAPAPTHQPQTELRGEGRKRARWACSRCARVVAQIFDALLSDGLADLGARVICLECIQDLVDQGVVVADRRERQA
jgi:hypothetical protein